MLKVTHNYTTWHRSSWAGRPAGPGGEGLPYQNETNQWGENAAGADDALGGMAPELLLTTAGDGAWQFDWQAWRRDQNHHALWAVTGE